MSANPLRAALAALLLAVAIVPSSGAAAAIWVGAKADEPAVGGNDPVAYFTSKTATPGRVDLTHVHEGATFRFATPENRAAFIADPERYIPQFGGHCAWAASQGRLAGPDPTIWRIVGDKLYLNCSKDAETKWLADVPGNIARGEAFWAAQEDMGTEP